jgi:hypothetical protein
MAFSRVKLTGWAMGEVLTSAQMNQLDIDHAASASSSNVPGDQDHSGVQVPIGCGVAEGNSSTAAWELFALILLQNDNTINKRWVIDVTGIIPPGVTVTQIQAVANGKYTGAAHTFPLGTYPELAFYEVDTDGTIVGDTISDNDTGSYEIAHTVTLTVSRLIDRLKRYVITINGEHGSNALDGHYAVTGLSVSWTAP